MRIKVAKEYLRRGIKKKNRNYLKQKITGNRLPSDKK